jgi:hypothetical protein
VAVGADDLASSHLGIDGLERRTIGYQRGDRCGLLADVIELQHDRIGLAAIDARMLSEVVKDIRAQASDPVLLGCLRLTPMKVPSRAKVLREAWPAVPLPPIAEAVEALERQLVPAPATAA